VVLVCRHAKRVSPPDRVPLYSAGFEFLPQPAERITRVLAMIAAATVGGQPLPPPHVAEHPELTPVTTNTATRSAASRQRRR
jgi:hypothetical protein